VPSAGLVLISYPLHPPGKPDRLRIEHLPQIAVPVLFVSGDRDPFGTPAELEAATAAIPGPVTHHWIPGGRHDLKGADDEICEVVTSWIGALRAPPRRRARG
jgi:predicted alpha/beta-hydrolase family hydrolase